MALYKKEVLVRPTSTANFKTAMQFSINWLTDNFQELAENKDTSGNYIDYYFADVFFANGHDTNSGQLWRIFSTPCEQKYTMTPVATGRIEFMISDLVGQQEQITQNANNVTQIDIAVTDHEVRIDTLENSSTEVEATVI